MELLIEKYAGSWCDPPQFVDGGVAFVAKVETPLPEGFILNNETTVKAPFLPDVFGRVTYRVKSAEWTEGQTDGWVKLTLECIEERLPTKEERFYFKKDIYVDG